MAMINPLKSTDVLKALATDNYVLICVLLCFVCDSDGYFG